MEWKGTTSETRVCQTLNKRGTKFDQAPYTNSTISEGIGTYMDVRNTVTPLDPG